MNTKIMHFVPVSINGRPGVTLRVNSIAFMQSLMTPIPQLRPEVAQHAAQARVVFGD